MSTARQEKAQQTKVRICTAARELFLTRGYAATTITEIAKHAGVAHQTVYFVFGSKSAVLAAILDIEIVGDAEPVPLLDRAPVRRVSAAKTPERRLQRVVDIAAGITERLAPVYEIVRSGAADDDVRELLDRHERQRWQSLRAMVGELEPDLRVDADEAADRLFALISHDVYWLLVRRRGWPADRWRRYVAEEATNQMIGAR